MKDEIKEILDNLVVNETTGMCYLSIKLTKQIKDCITNLQTIEQQYSAILSENAELENKITNLQEENKELKKKITFNEKSRRKMQQSLMEQIETYKSRNEKAIEMVKENLMGIGYVEVSKLLNILQGEDKE